MLPPLPRCSGWASSSLVSPNRVSLPRFHVRVGLHIVLFEVCSAFTRVAACTLARSPYVVTAIRRLQTLRLLHACSGCFRLERIAGWGLHPLESADLPRGRGNAAPGDHRATPFHVQAGASTQGRASLDEATAPRMKSTSGTPMALGNAAAARVGCTVSLRRCCMPIRPPGL